MDQTPYSDLFRVIMHKTRANSEHLLKELDVSPQQGRMIVYLAEHAEKGLIQKELAAIFDRRGASITSMLQGLEKKGYIERKVPADNERQKRVYVLPKGQKLVESINDAFQNMEKELVAGLSPAEQTTFLRLLEKVNDSL
ncbi:MarR family transcriptional regulator [Listeria monocytogenes]|uniref:Transcriptional regulator, MarR family n=2 Tax=Listeria grayi TaxID=1641 RepID=D7V1J9_LISGR|nr:MarR family transcriptional regulator [Listeria grayi]EAE8110570.1 MarR family transcriptional regulator [Listeria monocytogenes]EAF2199270.1 MarR family transcriptional regulator [Listeria monocytogenes]EAF2642000.1 MarR family transcriptional regulator [Listeria monocytogenes]EDN7515059.1 MarR family transcriptional regulator [Listeria monocytogenes]EFI82821.1 transcriptional regulator, MarR family [Listeria grayi DSM 20601]